MANEYVGNTLYVTFGGTEISSRFRSFDENVEVGMIDASAGADTGRSYISNLEDGGASMEFLHEAGGTAIWAALAPGTEGTLIWGPEGTTSTKPKHTVNAIVQSRRRNIIFDDVVKISVEWKFNGSVADSTY